MTNSQGGSPPNENVFKYLSRLFDVIGDFPLLSRLTVTRLVAILGITFSGSGLVVVATREPSANYDEKELDILSACSKEYMLTWGKKDLKQRYIENNSIPPNPLNIDRDDVIAERTTDRPDIWPVYRWECSYKSGDYKSAGRGLNLEKYCREAYGKKYGFGFKDYEDPDSFVCTRIDNSVNPSPSSCNKDSSSCQSKTEDLLNNKFYSFSH